MNIRKLDIPEHFRTRALWENVFAEDTKAFLDYYYFLKVRDNEIYVIEEEQEIRAMLQLNPYRIQVEEQVFDVHYIVGVATKKEYRGQGYMRELLVESMREMYRKKEWFTFLMPAAESIYTPYDFRFVYAQKQETIEAQALAFPKERIIECRDATIADAQDMAAFFFAHFAKRWQVCTARDENYYLRQIFEQQSEGGGIRLMKADGQIVGMFSYAREDGAEIMEPLYLPEYESDFYQAMRELFGGGQDKIKVFARDIAGNAAVDGKISAADKKEETMRGQEACQTPVIMARILRPELILAAMKVKEGEELDCSFAVLDSILPQNCRIWRICSDEEEHTCIQVRETEDSQGVLTIAALCSLLFGYQTIEEIAAEENVILPEHLQRELSKIRPLESVFINEVV